MEKHSTNSNLGTMKLTAENFDRKQETSNTMPYARKKSKLETLKG